MGDVVYARGWRGPDPGIGYYRGGPPLLGGEGSMSGPKQAGTKAGSLTSGTGSSDWHPSVRYLLVLLIAEIAVFGALRYYTKHGG